SLLFLVIGCAAGFKFGLQRLNQKLLVVLVHELKRLLQLSIYDLDSRSEVNLFDKLGFGPFQNVLGHGQDLASGAFRAWFLLLGLAAALAVSGVARGGRRRLVSLLDLAFQLIDQS